MGIFGFCFFCILIYQCMKMLNLSDINRRYVRRKIIQSITSQNEKTDNEKSENEFERKMHLNEIRKKTPCKFQNGISKEEFKTIVMKCGKKIKRIVKISFSDAIVYCTVESQSSISRWRFSIDFNDWGCVTSRYWYSTDNTDSQIPKSLANNISNEIYLLLKSKDKIVDSPSIYIETNKFLKYQENDLSYDKRTKIRDSKHITVDFNNDDLIGKHIYYVVSMLRYYGFNKVEVKKIEDVDDKKEKYIYEVEDIKFGNIAYVNKQDKLIDNIEIIIRYHSKRKIIMPVSNQHFMNKDVSETVDFFRTLGFINIKTESNSDLIIGYLKKENSVEKVTIIGNSDFQKGDKIYYDAKILISYHSIKSSIFRN